MSPRHPLTRYALERLLYRLSVSPYRNRFVLKGAMLVTTWFEDPHRPTRDLDLLGFGESSAESMLAIWKQICAVQADDGISFDTEALRAAPIRQDLEYGGLRLRTMATLARARINVTVDIGFGDAIEPAAEDIELRVLLDLPAPHLRAYARETVIAEKFHAMVTLGRTNSRMKRPYDIWVLSKTHEFDRECLAKAIVATFKRRRTEIPHSTPYAFTPEFFRDPGKVQQWTAFIRDLSTATPPFEALVLELHSFIEPFVIEARGLQDSPLLGTAIGR